MNIKCFGKWDNITEMLHAVSRFKADWMKSSESKYYSVSWLCEESQRTVKAKVNGNAKRNHDVLYILAGQLCVWLPLRMAIVCVAVQGQKDWEKKAENSSSPTDQGLCFCNARPALFHAELRWQEVALVYSLCLRNLTPVYKTESAFKGNRLWQKSASVFPCGVLSIIQCPGHHKHSWPTPVLQRPVLAFILCTCQCWYTSPGEPGLGIRSFPVVGDALETPSMEPSQGGSSPEVLLHSVLPRSLISAGVSE